MTDDEFRALVEQAHQVRELTQHPGWAVLDDYMNHVVMNPLKRRVLNGNGIDDHVTYRALVEFLQGAHRVLGVPDELATQVETERSRRADLEPRSG